jgi:glycosyltransferase involved in cell wall biosynthesis
VADLFVTSRTPVLGSGQAMRTYGLVRALAAGGPLDLLYVRHGAEEPSAEYRAMSGVTFHEVVPARGLGRSLTFARALLGGVPWGFARGVSAELGREAERLAGRPGRDRVIVDGPIVAAATAGLARRRPVIYNGHNFESSFRREAKAVRFGEHFLLPRFERRLIERASEAWMVSHRDVEQARALAPGADVRYVPNVVDVSGVTPVTPAGAQRALLVADFGWPPNTQAARLLVDEVFPLVWRELPGARLRLVGRGLPHDIATDERVEAVGFVEHLRDAYAASDCAVVPLLTGGGSPLKFVEALAYGLPVVATPHAAAGLDAKAGEHYREGADPQGLARALVEVLSSGAPDMAARGRALAEESYSIEALARILASRPAMEVGS